jgi:hypothetical protein
MNYRNYTDNLIEDFFNSNKIDDSNFFSKLEETIKGSQSKINNQMEKLMRENEYNSQRVNETKEQYFEKLELITSLYNNFELRVNHLNKHHSDKLSYISVLSNNLGEYEKFKKNIVFANKIFDLMNLLNSSEDISKILPDIFTIPDKMLEEGIEVFEAFRQLIDITGKDFPIFTKNFKTIEIKMKETIQDSIKDFYENNELNKLEKLMQVTEILQSEFIIDMYVKFILENMNLYYIIKSIKNISFDKVSEEMFSHVFKIIDEFHDNILKGCNLQFGQPASKIYLIFPESRVKLVISALVLQISKILQDFRQLVVGEQGKSDETYVKIIQYIYPNALKFVKNFKDTLEYSKTDLWNNIEQDTTLFLRGLEAIYMNKERNLLNSFIRNNYETKLKKVQEVKRSYDGKPTSLEHFQNETFDLIQATSFTLLHKFSVDTIQRYHTLIGSKEERIDLTETFCKSLLDCVKDLLEAYSNLVKLVIIEREKHNAQLSEPHYYIPARIIFLNNDFQQIFLYDLKDFFKSIKFYDEIEDSVRRRVNQLGIAIDQMFSQVSSYTSGTLGLMLKSIKFKETYHCGKVQDEYACSVDFDRICNFLRPLFRTVMENWPDNYKKKILQLITKIINDKLTDILKNAKLNENGVKLLKADFQRMLKTFCEGVDEFFFSQIHDTVFLLEIFTTPRDSAETFVDAIDKNKHDQELLKILIKKRKGLKS